MRTYVKFVAWLVDNEASAFATEVIHNEVDNPAWRLISEQRLSSCAGYGLRLIKKIFKRFGGWGRHH